MSATPTYSPVFAVSRPRAGVTRSLLLLALLVAGCQSTPEPQGASASTPSSSSSAPEDRSAVSQAIAEGKGDLEATQEVVATVLYLARRRLPDGRIDAVENIYTSDPASPYLTGKIRANEQYLGGRNRAQRVVPRLVKHLGKKEMGQLMELLRREGFFAIPPEDWTERAGVGPGSEPGLQPPLPLDRAPAIFVLRDGGVTGLIKAELKDDLTALKKFAATERALIRASRWL